MAQIIQKISVEVSKPNFFQAIVAKQYDNNSRFLKVTLVHNGEKIEIRPEATVTINAKRNDGTSNSFMGEVNADGTATVPVNYWMLELAGTLICDVSVIGADEKKLTTTTFIVEVEEAACTNGDISTEIITSIVTVVPPEKGGTGAETLKDARYAMNFIGVNPVASDTPTAWIAVGTGYAYISSSETPCFIHNYVCDNTVYQVRYSASVAGGIHYRNDSNWEWTEAQSEYKADIYSSFVPLGISSAQMQTDNKDLAECCSAIFNALPAKSSLKIHMNTNGTNTFLAELFKARLVKDLGLDSTYLDVCFEKLGAVTMRITVVSQQYDSSDASKSLCFNECSAIFRYSSVAPYLAPFVFSYKFEGLFSTSNIPHSDQVGTLWVNQPEYVDQMIAVAKSYYIKDAQYFKETGKHFFNYHQWNTCLNANFGYQNTIPSIWNDSQLAESQRRKYAKTVAEYNFLDCSAYINLILRGIPYEKSPYTLAKTSRKDWDRNNVTANTEDYPWAINPFDWYMHKGELNPVWDDESYESKTYDSDYRKGEKFSVYTIPNNVKYDYYDKQMRPRGAANLAKLLSSLGGTVDFRKDFSNVEPGDIILYGTVDRGDGMYEGITHIAICGSKEKLMVDDVEHERFKNYPYKHRIYDSTYAPENTTTITDDNGKTDYDVPTFTGYTAISNESDVIYDVISEKYLETDTRKIVAVVRPNLTKI